MDTSELTHQGCVRNQSPTSPQTFCVSSEEEQVGPSAQLESELNYASMMV